MGRRPSTDVRLKRNGIYWRLVWRDDAGRERTKSLGAASATQADRARRQFQAELILSPGIGSMGKAPTIKAWTDRYLADIRQTHAEGSVSLAGDTIAYLLERFDGGLRIDRITQAQAEDFAAWLRAKGLNAVTVARHARTLKAIWGRAIKAELIHRSPWIVLASSARSPEKTIPNLADDDVQRLIDAAPTRQWRCIIALCAWGGTRRNEAIRMKWEDVRWGDNRFFVRLPEGQDADTKHAERVTMMEPRLEATLLAAMHEAHDGSEGPCEGIPLENLHRNMVAIIRRAGLVPWEDPFHALRRWRVSTWKLRYPAPVVDKWLGHSSDVSESSYYRVTEQTFGLEAEVARLRAELEKMQRATADAATDCKKVSTHAE